MIKRAFLIPWLGLSRGISFVYLQKSIEGKEKTVLGCSCVYVEVCITLLARKYAIPAVRMLPENPLHFNHF